MKVRHGTLTGTVQDGAGFYWAVDGSSEGLVGLAAVHLGVRSGKRGEGGKTVQIWPAEGQHRVTALRLELDSALADMLERYRLATQDFTQGGGYFRVKLGSRLWRRDADRTDVRWDAAASSVLFLNNSGPFADAVLPGDYVQLEAGMNGWTQRLRHSSEETVQVAEFAPVSTCDLYLGGFWKDGRAGGAGIQDAEGNWVEQVQARRKKSGKGGKDGYKYYDSERTRQGLTGGPYTAWMLGPLDSCKIDITYPAATVGMAARVLKIVI